MNWGLEDFVAAGGLLTLVAIALWLALRQRRSFLYLAAHMLAVGCAVVIVWASLAVGIIGDEGNPANLVYAAVIGLGLGGAALSRLRPDGMAKTMASAAALQASLSFVAYLIAGPQWPVLAFNMAMTCSLAVSSALFLIASRRPPNAGAI